MYVDVWFRSTPFGIRSPGRARAIAMAILSVVLVWTTMCGASLATGSPDLDSELIETETGWQFDTDDIEVFDTPAPAPAAAAPAKAPAASGNTVALINGDFEATNLTGNASVTMVDSTTTAIVNWVVGGAGVQILNGNTYKMNNGKGVYAIHLNNPAATGNGTQGQLTTTLAINPPSGKAYTVQFDCARDPDGPINLFPAIKISSLTGANGSTVTGWELREPKYNSTDTRGSISWVRYSFIYTGTGAATMIRFEGMSEKYSAIIDNVVIYNGKHSLAAAPGSLKPTLVLQKFLPVFFAVVALIVFHSPLLSLSDHL